MLIARNINATEKYTLQSDTDDPTVYILGQVDNATRAYIEDSSIVYNRDMASDDATTSIKFRQRALLYVRFGLKGWTNMRDADGLEVPCVRAHEEFPHGRYEVISKESLDRLFGAWVEELGVKIRELSHLSEPDKKN